MVFAFPRVVSSSSEPAQHLWVLAPRHPTVDRPGRNGSVGAGITCLHQYGDSVLVGYGDWNANTGPIDVWSINPATLEWSLESANLPTEAIDKFVTFSGTTIALHTDPLGAYAWEDNKVGTIIGSQEKMTGNRVIHTFDAVELPDGSWWFVGAGWETEASSKDRAMGFLTRDRGKTWEHYWFDEAGSLVENRFYHAKVIDGLPAAYYYSVGWVVLKDGKFEAVNDKVVDVPNDLQINPPKYITGATVSQTVKGYSLIGTMGGDIWIRKED